ncbi:MAG: helix-hairpin-helix domain-containing protein [Elusimicrobia bacterium]|nr:helix-hairpin-helix domain-containing protein [Elusimicrobiota bacterium]MDD7502503.1 OB-fold domain-containing protein [Elusimicrobiota bacterium]MDY5729675.1 Holliday junction branch migration protein RuvA [Elusimicrobiaceae bacterium]
MIAYLKGEVLEAKEDGVILLCGGIGYEVTLAHSSALELTAGTQAALYIAESISPYDGTMLYGFLNKEDKALWLLFKTAIPNTGPKKALEFLNKALRSVADFHNAILKRDPKILTGIFGFTSKTAEKLINSLKDKMDAVTVQGESKIKVMDEAPYMSGVLEALSALGYSAAESRRAMEKLYAEGINPNDKIENIIKEALRVLKK